jgi:hypothetical protein
MPREEVLPSLGLYFINQENSEGEKLKTYI